MKRLRVGVVGTGALGRHHARIYSSLETTELIAVADMSADRGRAVAESCRTRWYEDFQSLFGLVDAVSIAVPTFAHLDVASEFLKRGIAVLVEKPLASNVTQAAALVAAAEAAQTTLQVGHVERFNPAAQLARRLAGCPRYIRAERTSPYAFRSTDIGVVLDVMIHDLDLILDLVQSPIADAEAFGVSILGENEDCAQARLRFKNGCIADLSANRVHPTSRRSMQIWSETGCLSVDLMARNRPLCAHRPAFAWRIAARSRTPSRRGHRPVEERNLRAISRGPQAGSAGGRRAYGRAPQLRRLRRGRPRAPGRRSGSACCHAIGRSHLASDRRPQMERHDCRPGRPVFEGSPRGAVCRLSRRAK